MAAVLESMRSSRMLAMGGELRLIVAFAVALRYMYRMCRTPPFCEREISV
jgi:hypothetical protein